MFTFLSCLSIALFRISVHPNLVYNMSQNDLVKVLKGAGMVLEIIVKNQRLHSNESFIKAQYHTTELIKLIFDVGLSHNSNKTNPYQQSQAASSSSSPSSSSSSTRVTNSKDSLNVESVVNEYISKEQNTPAAMKATAFPTSVTNTVTNTVDPIGFNRSTESLSQPVVSPPHTNEKVEKSSNTEKISPMRPKAVPATPFARVMGFGSLAVGLMYGQLAETTNKAIFGSDENSSSISEANANRLAESISRMRGAALKLGQMLSLQDDNFLPPTLSKALNRVRQSADYMPEYQLKEQLEAQDGWGSDWRRHFTEFDEVPIAAASIGQVHKAVLQSGEHVAVKIQYPGVARSIQSDLNNLKMIVTMANVLPKGLFIDQIIKVAGTELTAECK